MEGLFLTVITVMLAFPLVICGAVFTYSFSFAAEPPLWRLYSVKSGLYLAASVALSCAVHATVLSISGHNNHGIVLVGFTAGFLSACCHAKYSSTYIFFLQSASFLQ
jgi:hypothetical protein